MATDVAGTTPARIMLLRDTRWVRAHISTFCVGAVLLACANLLFGGSALWALTAIGIWIMLLVVHIAIAIIARLSLVLMADDDDEVVLLPIKDALIVDPKSDPAATWSDASAPADGRKAGTSAATETVSWTVATNAAQVNRPSNQESQQ